MQSEKAPTITYRLWIAGDYREAVSACREFCAGEGACFSISPAAYVYTGGMEDGVVVTLINYPRFPTNAQHLGCVASRLGAHLCAKLFQQSYTVEGPEETIWISHRVPA